MQLFDIDAVVVYIFLIFTFLVGLRYAGGVKSLKEYAIGGTQFSNVVLFATLSATVAGGYWLVGVPGEIYDAGIIYFVVVCGTLFGFSIAFFVMLPNIDSRFEGNISIADITKTLYGRIPSKIAAFFSMVHCGAVLCMQFLALGSILAQFLEIPFAYGVLIPALILAAYSTLGGMRSVAMTDLIQFCVVIVMVPLLAKFALDSNGGIVKVFSSMPEEKYSLSAIFDHPRFSQYLFLFFSCCLPFASLEATIVQRMLMCKNPITRKKLSVSFIVVMAFILVMGLFTAFATHVTSPDIDGSRVFAEAMTTFFPVGLKGLMIAGLTAAIMSTADSCLNTASVLAAQLFGFENRERSMLLVKMTTIFISCLAIAASLMQFNIIKVGIFGEVCAVVFVNVPMFLGICRFKISRKTYFISFGICGSFMLVCAILGVPIMYLPLMGAILAITILLHKQIFSFRFLELSLEKLLSCLPKLEQFAFKALKLILKLPYTPRLLRARCVNAVEKYKAPYFAFVFFCVLNYIFPLLNHNYLHSSAFDINSVLYIIAIVLCIGLLMCRHSNISHGAFAVYWIFTLFYCLPFMSVFLFLQHSSSLGWMVNMVLGIMLLASLITWTFFICLTILGSALALTLFIFFTSGGELHFLENNIDIAAITILLSLIIGSLFVRHRQMQQEEHDSMMHLFNGTVAHELRSPFAAVQMQANMLLDATNSTQVSDDGHKQHLEFVNRSAQQLKILTNKGLQFIEMLLIALKENLVMLDYGDYSMKDCIHSAISEYSNSYPERAKRIVLGDGKSGLNDFCFRGSELFAKHLLLNLIDNAFEHAGRGVIVSITSDGNSVSVKDNGCGIKQEVKKRIFDRFFTTSVRGTGIGLAFCCAAMRKMDGTIKCTSVLGKYTKFTLQFPTVS